MDKVDDLKNIITKDWEEVVIVSHKVPDIDSIASQVLMSIFVESLGVKNVTTVINTNLIRKPNQKKFFIFCGHIPKKIVRKLPKPNKKALYIIVDGQPWECNVPNLEGVSEDQMVIIDHHVQTTNFKPIFKDINIESCSCTALLYKYVKDLHIKGGYNRIQDLVYHGMYGDSNGFKKRLTLEDNKLRFKLEVGDFSQSPVNLDLVTLIHREEFSESDREHLLSALANYKKYKGVTIVETNKCDTNVLGNITDIVSIIEGNSVVIAYFIDEENDNVRLSIRSFSEKITAHKLIKHLTEGVGEGGGHLQACAGYLKLGEVKCVDKYLKLKLKEIV